MFALNLAGAGSDPKSCSYLSQPACLRRTRKVLYRQYKQGGFILYRAIVENGNVQKYMFCEDFLLSINVKCFDRNKYLLIQKYFYTCIFLYSGHINVYITYKRHKGMLLISLNRQCILLSEAIQEKKPCFWLFLLWLSDP